MSAQSIQQKRTATIQTPEFRVAAPPDQIDNSVKIIWPGSYFVADTSIGKFSIEAPIEVTLLVTGESFRFANFMTLVKERRGASPLWERIIAAAASIPCISQDYLLAWDALTAGQPAPRSFDEILSQRLNAHSPYNNLHAAAFTKLLYLRCRGSIRAARRRLADAEVRLLDELAAMTFVMDLRGMVDDITHRFEYADPQVMLDSNFGRTWLALAAASAA